jgi:radical SAM superfamily enzyme YgiQ (UPF0313 family)
MSDPLSSTADDRHHIADEPDLRPPRLMSPDRRIPVYSASSPRGHPPLALGMITAFAKSYKGGLLNAHYEFMPQFVSSVGEMHEQLRKHGPGVLLFSNYIWNAEENLLISKLAKAFYGASITVHGGPSVPKYDYSCEQFFRDHPHVDIAVRGEGEATAAELLEQLAIHPADYARGSRRFLSKVRGITFRSGGEAGASGPVRTEDRSVSRDLNAFPSPYLTGEFRPEDSRLWRAAIIETNRGCPYGCTFCDWGSATLSKIRQFPMERVAAEIEWCARNRIEILWIADANFGIFDRDVEIARIMADCHARYGFPRQLAVNYAKNATARLARIVEILHRSGVRVNGIISIQTRDPEVLSVVNRSNISSERYEELTQIFLDNRLPVSTDLMIGLPGSTFASLKSDLQFFYDRGIPVKCYPTTLLPNSPMAHRDYRAKFRIEVDASDRLVSTYSYTRSDLKRMKRLSRTFEVAVMASVLKYLLVYLQLDYGLIALDVLEHLSDRIHATPRSLPRFAALVEGYPARLCGQGSDDWEALYLEIGNFLADHYAIEAASLNTVLRVQKSVMPANGRTLPEAVTLDHDFAAYFAAARAGRDPGSADAPVSRRLADYGPGLLEIDDPHELCGTNSDRLKTAYDNHCIEWELSSPLTS